MFQRWAPGYQPDPAKTLYMLQKQQQKQVGHKADSLPSVKCQMNSLILSAKTTTRIGTWNMQTLYQVGKLAQLLREFDAYQLP